MTDLPVIEATPPEDIQTGRNPDVPFELTFRAITQEDLHFVLNAWMRSYRDTKRNMSNRVYYNGHQRLIAALADRRELVIGCDANKPDWIVGFACGQMLEDDTLLIDYVYVKQPYRMRGIGRALCASLGWRPGMNVTATHYNKTATFVAAKYIVSYNDYYLTIGFDK